MRTLIRDAAAYTALGLMMSAAMLVSLEIVFRMFWAIADHL